MSRKPPTDPFIVVLGATGTGKSQLAVDLATRYNGEIINGDAMQMYDGLPIITNKITVEEQQGIPHHLLGFIPLHEEPWRVGKFKSSAGRIIQEIRSRGRLPILVGGTHYYTQSLLFQDALVTEEGEAGEDAAELSNQQISEKFPILDGPVEVMIQRLKEVDPVIADRWHPKDVRKIRRSLEIYLMTGKKASDIYNEQKEIRDQTKAASDDNSNTIGSPPAILLHSTLFFWVHAERETLKKRLDNRVDKMLDSGLLDEVKSMDSFLRNKATEGISIDRSRGIWVSIGWKEFEQYLVALDAGTQNQETPDVILDLSIEETKAATRQYARRQVRWILLKLLPALRDQELLKRLYLLDGSDLTQWTDTVHDPAIDITGEFLAGGHLRAPTTLSEAAQEYLSLEKPATVQVLHECETCHTTTVTEDQWQAHLKSRTHRRQMRKNLKSERRGTSPGPERDDLSGIPSTP